MSLDTYLDATFGCSNMKDFKRNLGMEGEKSSDVLTYILLGCVADRVKAIEHPAEFYADYESLSSAMQSLEEAFRD